MTKKVNVTPSAEGEDDAIGIVMPALMDDDRDEDFSQGMEDVGDSLWILPLRNLVLFPGVAMPVMIGRAKSLQLIKEVAHKKSMVGVVCQKDTKIDEPGFEDLYEIGVVAEVIQVLELPDGSTTAIIQGKNRFRLHELTETDPFMEGRISVLETRLPRKNDREFEALVSAIRDLTEKMLNASGDPPRDIWP